MKTEVGGEEGKGGVDSGRLFVRVSNAPSLSTTIVALTLSLLPKVTWNTSLGALQADELRALISLGPLTMIFLRCGVRQPRC